MFRNNATLRIYFVIYGIELFYGIETWFIFYILTIGVLVYKTIFVQLNYIYFHNKKNKKIKAFSAQI